MRTLAIFIALIILAFAVGTYAWTVFRPCDLPPSVFPGASLEHLHFPATSPRPLTIQSISGRWVLVQWNDDQGGTAWLDGTQITGVTLSTNGPGARPK